MSFILSNIQKRFFLFLLGCIPSRLLLSYLAFVSTIHDSIRIVLSVLLISISIGFMYIYIGGLRKTGLETMGQSIWWNSLRPLHSVLYGASGITLLCRLFGNTYNIVSSALLIIDTIIGLIAFIMFHYGNMSYIH